MGGPKTSRTRRWLAIALGAWPLIVLVALAIGTAARAQESGGSFGGSSWDEEPSERATTSSSARSGPTGSSSSPVRTPSSGGGGTSRARSAAQVRADQDAERARRLALPREERARELLWPLPSPYTPLRSSRAAATEAPFTGPRSEPDTLPFTAPSTPTAIVTVTPPPRLASGLCFGIPVALVVWVVASRVLRHVPALRPSPRAHPSAAASATPGTAMRLSIAFDWTVRAALQRELAKMSSRVDVRDRRGLSEASRIARGLLAANAGAARYATWELSTGDARTWFQTRANDLRSRYRVEMVRNADTSGGPDVAPHEHEGPGLVVVSIVVAGKRPITPPSPSFDAAGLASAIGCIDDRGPAETLALEVIWSPAAEADRMSSYELEKIYPELQRIADGVGARQCAYCRGPFPTELGRCPNCGAPI